MASNKEGTTKELFYLNIENYKKFRQWCIWYPDLWLDSITPEEGKIVLDFDQRVFLRIVFRFYAVYGVFPRAWGKCVTGDSLIYTKDGMIEIGSLFDYSEPADEEIVNHNIEIINRYGKKEKSLKGISSGLKETIKIKTNFGYELEGTKKHPILIMDKNGNIDFKRLENITYEDYIIINRKNNLFGENISIDVQDKMDEWFNSLSKQSSSHLVKTTNPKEITEDIAYLIGLLTGDGCLTRDNLFIFSNIDENINNEFYRIIESNFNINKSNIKIDGCDNIIRGKYLRKYLELIGLSYADSRNKEIPESIMRAPKEIVSSFISGLFDTDGTVDNRGIYYCTVSEKLAKQIQFVLLNYGIISKLYQKGKENKHFIISITGKNINIFKDNFILKSNFKQDRINNFNIDGIKTNTDIIPNQQKYINEICTNSILKDKLYGQRAGNSNLTYYKLEDIIKYADKNSYAFKHFQEIKDTEYFFDRISKIEQSENFVYDIQTQETHSFISNGFVSHNTFLEALAMVMLCVIYPNLDYVMTAQTKENAASILGAKIAEIRRFYPILDREMSDVKIQKNVADISFYSGSRIFILANNQASKGQRATRMNIEEAALLNNDLYLDVLEPIPAIPRRTVGKLCVSNPMELSGQINFFTTSGFRSSDEFDRVSKMIKDMVSLDGHFVIGSDWQLACWFNRGVSKEKILKKKENNSPLSFAQNYQSKWVGSSDGALVNINTLLNCRTLIIPKTSNQEHKEMYLAVDVARSDRGNNQTALAIFEVIRDSVGFIVNIDLVNLFTITGDVSFSKQSLIVKKTYYQMNCQGLIIDSNGLGMGLLDELRKDTKNESTGESYPAFGTVNTDVVVESKNYIKCIFDLKPQSANTDIIVSFIDSVNSGQFRMLMKKSLNDYDIADTEKYESDVLPFLNTDILVEEISNLKLKQNSAGRGYSVIKNVGKIDKDRWAATAYGLWYIRTFKNSSKQEKSNLNDYIISSKGSRNSSFFDNNNRSSFGKRGASRR